MIAQRKQHNKIEIEIEKKNVRAHENSTSCDLNLVKSESSKFFLYVFFFIEKEHFWNLFKMKDIEQCLKDDETIVSSAAEFAKGMGKKNCNFEMNFFLCCLTIGLIFHSFFSPFFVCQILVPKSSI